MKGGNKMYNILRKIKNIFLFFIKQFKWKKNNSHNNLSITTSNYITLNINKMTCGKGTYGKIQIEFYGAEDEELIIGSYCSIAPGVQIILGGNHVYTYVSTFPFDTFFFNKREKNYTKGKVIIEDDVWIGTDATILSGVKLGQGSIIGAKSVVTKNVPPYAIVVGNPARIIKYRFEDDIIKGLLKLDFNKLNMETRKLLYTNITLNNVNDIVYMLNLENKCL